MTGARPWLSLVLAACVGATISLWAQAPADAPVVKIVSPGDDAYVTGATLLRATIVPAEAVTGMTFFVDGR